MGKLGLGEVVNIAYFLCVAASTIVEADLSPTHVLLAREVSKEEIMDRNFLVRLDTKWTHDWTQ